MSPQPLLQQVSGDRLRRDLYHLSRDPLPFRKVNYTRPGQHIHSLAEADLYIRSQLEAAGWPVKTTPYQVQPFRCDRSKPLHHWYAKPDPTDPFYEAANLEATWPGREKPEQLLQLISHKDSMSWIDSPGAHDNAVGTVANLELARLIPLCGLRRSVRILFCNEEHTPWTSRFAAEEAAARGDQIYAVLNVDSLDGKPDEEMAAGRHVHVITHSTEEGKELAEFVAGCAARHGIDLEVRLAFKEHINDDDGMFINAGFRNTVMNLGSWPYADSEYHLPGDTPDRVNIENVVRSTQLLLAALIDLDAQG
ncbi:MAG: M28 family peptidase [Candidatus Latescibacteria bacterium]|nr:M28 family peptidase [Candidatus Latescibacterota bacterium]